MQKKKLYKARSIAGAERRVRNLQKLLGFYEAITRQYTHELIMLAKLAATGPAFTNPSEVVAAERLRDELLRRNSMNPDGTFINLRSGN